MPAQAATSSNSAAAMAPLAIRVKRARAFKLTVQLRDKGDPPQTPHGATNVSPCHIVGEG
jgi:hypothetical protein